MPVTGKCQNLAMFPSALTVFGILFSAGNLLLVQRSRAIYWKRLAVVYAARKWPQNRLGQKLLVNIIFFGSKWSWVNYSGVTTIAVTENGIWLRLLLPIFWLHRPLFLPFTDLIVEQGDWYLNPSTFEIRASDVENVWIAIPGDLLDWISELVPHWQVNSRRGW